MNKYSTGKQDFVVMILSGLGFVLVLLATLAVPNKIFETCAILIGVMQAINVIYVNYLELRGKSFYGITFIQRFLMLVFMTGWTTMVSVHRIIVEGSVINITIREIAFVLLLVTTILYLNLLSMAREKILEQAIEKKLEELSLG